MKIKVTIEMLFDDAAPSEPVGDMAKMMQWKLDLNSYYPTHPINMPPVYNTSIQLEEMISII